MAEALDPTALTLDQLRQQLSAARARVARLERAVEAAEAQGPASGQMSLPPPPPPSTAPPVTNSEKVAFFLDLFGTRRNVFPRRWDNPRTGKAGYSPACGHEWRSGICGKPKVRCTECPHQQFPPLDAVAIKRHLRGEETLGVYAITDDSRCRFLAADFDGESWAPDVKAFRDAAARSGLVVAVERSRSGNGAHGWLFFRELVPAILARKLGSALLARAAASRPTMSMAAFDRMFPNQDVVPSGGWGNLIALPLAKQRREVGCTVFVDDALQPFADQWAYLASIPRVSLEELEVVTARLLPQVIASEPTDDPRIQADEEVLDLSRPSLKRGILSGEVTIRIDSKLRIPRPQPLPVLACLKRLATMANPIFQEKVRLRFATYDTPRFLFAGEWHPDRLVLPRGALEPCVRILEEAGASVVLQDGRVVGKECRWRFRGKLRPEQRAAVAEMLNHDLGILCAPPGAGKTVMGCALAAKSHVATLVLVHRAVLLDQWRAAAIAFLGLKKTDIGIWRGSAPRLTHKFDIAMLPSVSRAANLEAAFADYGVVLVDECHHVPAASFELLLKACPARRIYGLTATPYRKDRLEKLLYFQCGPIRHTMQSPAVDNRTVLVRRTGVKFPAEAQPIHAIWETLVADSGRRDLIVADIAACVAEGRSPLALADRKSYLDAIETALDGRIPDVPRIRLESGAGKKARQAMREQLDRYFTERRPFVLLATASLVGEGFDLPQLDTLVLAMPLSFKGRLVQYAGRLHREHAAKASPRIHDYLDENCAVTRSMYRRRLGAYHAMGYNVGGDEVHEDSLLQRMSENG